MRKEKASYFDGGLLQLIGWSLLGAIVTGLFGTWMLCLLLAFVTLGIYCIWIPNQWFNTREHEIFG
ncbi:hypothetical protein [uncultured Treponema sp.]|uniref:hypothetical protein n=1 Tax=uncultured Treponema sp. TaxID=162155 RepID=UPI00260135FA|nr:hypothetical protein [uncultured Treponema sp.]